MRLKKNKPYNHWLKSQGHYLLCFSTSRTVGANSVRLRHETGIRYSLKATTKIPPPTCLISTLLWLSCAFSPPFLSRTVLSYLVQSLSTFGRGIRVFQKKFIKREGCTPPDLCNLLKTISENFLARFFE